MNAFYSISPDAVRVLGAVDKPAILASLSQVFADAYALAGDEVLERLEERETLGSTGFGRGVAIPHARLDGLARPVAALVRLTRPVDFAAHDAMAVELVFGLLSPANSGALHLQALAAISRLMREDKVRDALIAASDAEALYALVLGAAERDAA